MSINKLFLSEASSSDGEIFYFGGKPIFSKEVNWPVSSNGNHMNHVFTISTSIINKHTSLLLPEGKIVTVFSDNSYIGDLCESPQMVEKHFSKVILSDIGVSCSAPNGIEVYPKRYIGISKENLTESAIGGTPSFLQNANLDKKGSIPDLENTTFLLQISGTDITDSIGERVDEGDHWYYTNNIFEDGFLYLFLEKEINNPESAGYFFLQMT